MPESIVDLSMTQEPAKLNRIQFHIWTEQEAALEYLCGVKNPNASLGAESLNQICEEDICPICLAIHKSKAS